MKKMSIAAKAVQREYLRQWKMKNPDKVAAHIAAYWERKANEVKTQDGQCDESKKS